MAYLKINNYDIAPYIDLDGGFNWSENDLDAPNSGRTLDATMHRGKVASKFKFEIKLIPVGVTVVSRIFGILRNEYITVSTDMIPGASAMTMYNSTRSGGVRIVTTDNQIKYRDVSFHIIQR